MLGVINLIGQKNPEVPNDLNLSGNVTQPTFQSELVMTFPSIYFQHNSTEYAVMPYSVDSCFKFIAQNFKDSYNSLVIWRDSLETEELTNTRIQKLQAGLKKYLPSERIEIHSMGGAQKISRQTINSSNDSLQRAYLLSLNSVFDISKTKFPQEKSVRKKRRRLVWTGWKHGFHWSTP